MKYKKHEFGKKRKNKKYHVSDSWEVEQVFCSDRFSVDKWVGDVYHTKKEWDDDDWDESISRETHPNRPHAPDITKICLQIEPKKSRISPGPISYGSPRFDVYVSGLHDIDSDDECWKAILESGQMEDVLGFMKEHYRKEGQNEKVEQISKVLEKQV